MAANPRTTHTVEEYLAFERASETKHEYYGGEIVAMAGASYAHNVIVGNIGASLHGQLRNRQCAVVVQNLRLSLGAHGPLVYPDVTVVCGQPQFIDTWLDTVTNSTIIIEVLSPSTEGDDRGRKAKHYRTLDTLREYVLITPDECQVEHFVRAENGWWYFNETDDLAATIRLTSIDCTLALADIYERVTFDPAGEGRR